jgi:hypothetical protein
MAYQLSPELEAQIETERKERAVTVAEIWRDDLTYKDWLFDGSPIRGEVMIARFNNLDWDNAWTFFTELRKRHSPPY